MTLHLLDLYYLPETKCSQTNKEQTHFVTFYKKDTFYDILLPFQTKHPCLLSKENFLRRKEILSFKRRPLQTNDAKMLLTELLSM